MKLRTYYTLYKRETEIERKRERERDRETVTAISICNYRNGFYVKEK